MEDFPVKARPWSIIILALLHVGAPIFNSILSSSLQGLPVLAYLKLLVADSSWWGLFDYFLVLPLAGLAIYSCKRSSYPLVFLAVATTVFGNIQTWRSYPAYFPLWMLALVTLLDLLLVGYFLLPAVKILYLDPSIRWWESKPRYLIRAECQFSVGERTQKAWITDFSEGGLFLNESGELEAGSTLIFSGMLLERPLKVSGKVVYRRGGERPGFGVQFVGSSKEVRSIIKELKRQKYPVRTPFDWKKDFKEWLVLLFRTGKGIVPDKPVHRR
ncbi:MAG TPA: hypothetical protein DCS07_01045 [Bdellovibrionales bacterium]|nr:MAG: hypothetical protein A2Z97_10405 [Bdellovibrionales bacterium GWB1_52_6]OFZ05998.1 MAG: hypothetical protein A2X97_01525 [Bdellovibrionales bacterium GWA1_52_35]OFZ33062.1 MAG: hypothetical protein A2070_08175 [Bdellovibrionales bacterium GWC1_52_8]HAR41213.1 hypothetical protein [Bdellovibrionales bacterium]HCM39380.1 hypothetical protein [Bdellovibrionales bacterium]